jgi:hypothetical protein
VTSHVAPQGEERKVKRLVGVAIDGAPIVYVVLWAAVIVALSFVIIPVSLVLGVGKSFPLSQAVYPLVGIVLGPWAGALAAVVGRVIGLAFAPLTATGPFSPLVALVVAAAGGILVEKAGNKWLLALGAFAVAFVAYIGLGMTRGISLGLALRSTWVNWVGVLLWVLPTRRLARAWIASPDPAKLAAGLVLGCWMVNTSCYIVANALFYPITPWTAPEWELLALVSPVEHVVRTVVGSILGMGVILGLRAIGLVKPTKAGY